MRRFLAFVLIVVTLMTMCGSLAGCSTNSPLHMGTWLTLIADSFGMESYTAEKPYFAKVSESDSYYSAFQMAAEWDILDPDSEISSTTAVKWKDALITLVNAGEFLPVSALDDEKIQFAIDNFDKQIRTYWMNRNIKISEAMPLLEKAAEMWRNTTYEESIEELEFGDQVTNLLYEEGIEYETTGNVVRINKDTVAGLEPGDVYTLPGSTHGDTPSINRVSTIEYDGDVAIITNDPDITAEELGEQVQSIQIRDTSPVDFSNIEAIYDAQGNVVYTTDAGVNTALTSEIENDEYIATLQSVSEPAEVIKAGFFDKQDLTLKVGEKYKAKLSFEQDSLSLTLTETAKKKTNQYRSYKRTKSVSVKLEDIQLTKDIDYSWGKLNSATVKLDYKASVSGGISSEKERAIGEEFAENNFRKASLSSIKSGFAQAINHIKQSVYETKYDNDSIYICRIRLAGGGVASLDFIVEGKITVTGDLKLTISMAGAKGIQYKNGNIRYISSNNPSFDASGEASAEVMIAPGFEVNVLKIVTIKATMDLGVGLKGSFKVYIVDAEWHKLYSGDAVLTLDDVKVMNAMTYTTSAEDILAEAEAAGATWKGYEKDTNVELFPKACVELAFYPVVRVTGSVEIGKLEYSGSKEFLGSKNTKAKIHCDLGWNVGDIGDGFSPDAHWGSKCTYEFKPWDDSMEKIEAMEETMETDATAATYDAILEIDGIMLSESSVFLNKGETRSVSVTGLPEGYRPGDLVGESDDNKIARISVSEGKIYAGTQAGSTLITVRTSDGKYEVQIGVTVYENQIDDFQGIGGEQIV